MAGESIESLAKALADALPDGLKSLRDDAEKNFRAVLKSGVGKLDLVSREDFEVQQLVLARTREKLERLEARLETLEKKSARKKPAAKTAGKKAAKKKVKKKAKRKASKKSSKKKA